MATGTEDNHDWFTFEFQYFRGFVCVHFAFDVLLENSDDLDKVKRDDELRK